MSAPEVDPRPFPDPFVAVVPGGYVAYATGGDGANVRMRTSPDLRHWADGPDPLPALPGWAAPGPAWSPAVLDRGDHCVLYSALEDRRSGRRAVSAAVGPGPTGPFVDASPGPLIDRAGDGGAIDPSPFVDGDGTVHLLWKLDANAVQRRTSLWALPLAPDGLTPAGPSRLLLEQESEWERPLIEAPSVLAVGGRHHLLYSGNWWNTPHYAIGHAVAPSLAGPWTRTSTARPWMASDPDVAGPGGQEWFVGHDGVVRIAYHGWPPGRVMTGGGARSLRLAEVAFDDDGLPVAPVRAGDPAARRTSWLRALFGR